MTLPSDNPTGVGMLDDNHHFCHETRDVKDNKKYPNSIVGRRMRERREALGLAQEKVGAAIGLDESRARARISRYKLGEHEPPYKTVNLLAKVRQVPVAYLYCEDEEIG